MTLIDANVMLRFLLGDNEEMLAIAKREIESGKAYTLPSVLAEVVYVLHSHYEVERSVVRDVLVHLLVGVPISLFHLLPTYYLDYHHLGTNVVDNFGVVQGLLQ